MVCKNNRANANWIWRGVNEMSKNNSVVPQARAALDQFKMEAAREVDVQSLIKKHTLWPTIRYNVSKSSYDLSGKKILPVF